MSDKTMTVCGIYCHKECKAYGRECAGCNELSGKVSWAKFLGKTECPIYNCVKAKGLAHCGQCDKLPCSIWLEETKNPDMTDEEYLADITHRQRNLKELLKKENYSK